MQVTWRCLAVPELPKALLKMASGLISPSGLAGHRRQLCNDARTMAHVTMKVTATSALSSCHPAISTHHYTDNLATGLHSPSLDRQLHCESHIVALFCDMFVLARMGCVYYMVTPPRPRHNYSRIMTSSGLLWPRHGQCTAVGPGSNEIRLQ